MKPLRLLNLLASNSRRGEFRAEGNTIFIYDVIVGSDAEAEFWGGVSPEAFAKTLRGMSGAIELRINSPGGDVFGARAIAAAMKEHDGEITAYVDGYAASAASLIAVAADKVVMADGAMMMIHKAWTFAMGNETDLIATAELLGKIDATLAETYAAKSGGNADEFAALMANETWFTAAEAVSAGLADETAPTERQASKARARWDLSAFDRAPAAPANETQPDMTQSESEHRARAHRARMLAKAA